MNTTQLNRSTDILLIEDDPYDAELTLDLLRTLRLPNRIIHLPDGADLPDYLRGRGPYASRGAARLPAVIFLDVTLSILDDLSVLAAFQAVPDFMHIPVFMLTGSQAERDRCSSRLLGVAGYIVKPIEVHEFCEALRRAGLSWMLAHRSAHAVQPAVQSATRLFAQPAC